MSKLSRFFVVVVSLLVAYPASAGLITFGEVPLGTSVDTEYGSVGVLFAPTNSGGSTSPTFVTLNSPSIASPGSGTYAAFNTLPVFGSADTLIMDFVDPSNNSIPGWVAGSGLSFVLWDTESSVNFWTYDVNGNPLGGGSLATNVPTSFGSFSGDVHRVVFSDSGGDGLVIDQIGYGAITAIPEPATFGLLGAGLLAIGLLRRRS